MTRTLNHEEQLALEAMIDAATLPQVLLTLANICADKAQHIRENWQDQPLAERWAKCSNETDYLAGRLSRKREMGW